MELVAYRARQIIPLRGEGPARGADLYRPLEVLDNGVVLAHGQDIAAVESWPSFRLPAGARVVDLGEHCLVPGLINAHTHLQLSSLAGKTLWNAGFVPWLRSLIALLGEPLNPADLQRAVEEMRASGIIAVGDYTSHGLAAVRSALQAHGMDAVHFCEHFGFGQPPTAQALPPTSALPPPVEALMQAEPALRAAPLAPAGHALYSTHPDLLRRAYAACQALAVPFSLHLAESPEEDAALTTGTGPLVELYAARVLPKDWKAPGLRPVPAAAAWGLLGPGTLAVHGVQCDGADCACLAATGTALCLCPRSNAVLGVGMAPVRKFIDAGITLCIGTDGLSSTPSLNLWEEARMLLHKQDIAFPALLRMLTINGAACLGKKRWGALAQGKGCAFSVLPQDFEVHPK